MALSGSPAISDPRTQDRPTQQAISNIRQRIEAIEAALNATVNVANSSLTNQSGNSASLGALAAAVALLQTQVAALQSGVAFYLDGVLVGSRRALDMRSSPSVLVTATDDTGLARIEVTWTVPVYAAAPAGGVALAGWAPDVFAGVPIDAPAGAIAVDGWAPTRIP